MNLCIISRRLKESRIRKKKRNISPKRSDIRSNDGSQTHGRRHSRRNDISRIRRNISEVERKERRLFAANNRTGDSNNILKGANMGNLYTIFKITVNAAGIIALFLTGFVMITYAIGSGSPHHKRRTAFGIAGFLLIAFMFFSMIWS